MDQAFSSQPAAVSAQGGRLQPGSVDATNYTAPTPTGGTIPVFMSTYRQMREEA